MIYTSEEERESGGRRGTDDEQLLAAWQATGDSSYLAAWRRRRTPWSLSCCVGAAGSRAKVGKGDGQTDIGLLPERRRIAGAQRCGKDCGVALGAGGC